MVLIRCRDVDQVHDMMDDIAEQQDVAREISDAISNPVAFGKSRSTTKQFEYRNQKKQIHKIYAQFSLQVKISTKTNWNAN